MIKKAFITLSLILTLCFSLGLAGCFLPTPPDEDDGGNGGHECVASTEWKYDDEWHWHPCHTDQTCVAEYDKAPHDFDLQTRQCICGKDNGGFLANGLEFTPYDNGYEVSMGTCELTEIDIPATFKNKPVLKIADYAFSYTYNEIKLTKITIPDSVTVIGEYAFSEQHLLVDIEISQTSNLQRIEKCAFALRDSDFSYDSVVLEELNLPTSLTYIGKDAFYMVNVNKLYYAGTLDSWVQVEFDYSINDICKPYNIEELYINGTLLTEVNTGNATVIERGPFDNVHSIEKVVVGSALETLGEYAFHHCSSLTTVDMSGATSLKNICSYSFATCSSLTGLEVPYGVTHFENGVYEWSYSFNWLKLPKTITHLGVSSEIGGTHGSAKLYYEGAVNEWVKIVKSGMHFGFSLFTFGEFYVNGNELVTNVILTETDIDVNSFVGYNKLESVTYAPGTLETFNLSYCTALKTVNLPEGVKRVNSLWGCTLLENITFPAGVEYIESLRECTSLKNVVIPSSVKQAFSLYGVKAQSIIFEENSQISTDGENDPWWTFEYAEIGTLVLPDVSTDIYYQALRQAKIENLTFKAPFVLRGGLSHMMDQEVTPAIVGLEVTNLTVHVSNLGYFGSYVPFNEHYGDSTNNKIKNVTVFGDGELTAFENGALFEHLESVTILEGITAISSNLFGDNVVNFTIASSVTTIGSQAICAENVYCNVTEKPSGWASDWVNENANVVWKTEE